MRTPTLRKILVQTAFLFVTVSSLATAVASQTTIHPGDLDTTFGNGGIVITSGYTVNQVSSARGMAIQSDGKIVVVGDGTLGYVNWDFTVVRYNSDGSLDTSFGSGGIVTTQLSINYDGASAVAIQADGKIVVAGSTPGCVAVVRYNPDGALDTSFNGTGIVITPVGGGANSIAIQADGKIVVAGSGFGSAGAFGIVRYNPTGTLDTSFNGTGMVITSGGGINSVAIQSDGKIIAAGESRDTSHAAFMLVRYNPNGTLDTSFNGSGTVITSVGDFGSSASALALQTDGRIVVAGNSFGNNSPASMAVVRYNLDGSLDASFGGTGKIINVTGTDYALAVAIQLNGKIVVAGYSYYSVGGVSLDGSNFAVVRFNTNGSLDTSFKSTGEVITPVGYGWAYAASVVIQADGNIVAAGGTGPDEFPDFAVARYQGDAPNPACSSANPIDCPDFFIRQQYLDFLGREADADGFANWMATLQGCGNGGFGEFDNPLCDRVHVSAGFVQSNEFQGRGYWLLRFGDVGLNRSIGSVRSSLTYSEFTPALAQVGGSNSPAQEEAAKVAYTNAFVQRQDFLALFPLTMTASQYVNALESNAQVTLSNKQALIDALNAGTMTRADVLRNVVESQVVFDKYIIPAFVTMEYFGYLRRDPDVVGYQNWVNTLESNPSNYRHMIFGFIYSTEYRSRFGTP